MNSIGPVEADYGSEAALKAHYRAVRERLSKPRVVPQLPPPVVKPAQRPSGLPMRFERVGGRPSRSKPMTFVFKGNLSSDTATLRIPLTPDRRAKLITAAVAFKHGVTVNDIQSSRRPKEVVAARFEAAFRLYHKTKMSLPEIGRFLGGRDHTSILHGLKMFKAHPERYRPNPKANQHYWSVGFEAAE